ncbi:MAG: AI-2E family transporter [Syntrophomonas sp.]|nr:AI-2E family transporter [Syntrophomonas sp.]
MPWLLRNRVFRCLLLMAVAGATFYFLFLIREVLLSFLLGGIIAYFLYRPVVWIEKKGIRRVWAIIIIYILAVILLTLTLWLVIPKLAKEMSSVAAIMPEYVRQFEQVMEQVNDIKGPEKFHQLIQQNVSNVENYIYGALQDFVSVIYSLLSKVFIIIFAPILAFYILRDWEGISAAFLNILPPKTRHEVCSLSGQIDTVIIEFSKGYLLIAVIIGVLTGAAAFLIGVKFALLIGIISAISDLVPYFGPLLGGIPAVVLALSESPQKALYMGLAIFILQQIEANVISPRIIGDKVGMHPLLIVFALLAGGQLMGIWGMLIAVPLTASLKIIICHLYLKIVDI